MAHSCGEKKEINKLSLENIGHLLDNDFKSNILKYDQEIKKIIDQELKKLRLMSEQKETNNKYIKIMKRKQTEILNLKYNNLWKTHTKVMHPTRDLYSNI